MEVGAKENLEARSPARLGHECPRLVDKGAVSVGPASPRKGCVKRRLLFAQPTVTRCGGDERALRACFEVLSANLRSTAGATLERELLLVTTLDRLPLEAIERAAYLSKASY